MANQMSDEHKAALAKGRRQARAVRDYLEALEWEDRRKGRMDRDSIQAKIAEVSNQIDGEDDPAKRVELIQRRIDLEQRLEQLEEAPDVEELKRGFVAAVMEYSERKGISYMAWREAGVPAATLKEAGMKRTYEPPEAEE